MDKKLAVFSWAMYDFANNIFAMNVISLYFALWVTVDKGGQDIVYSAAFAVSMLLSAAAAPVIGMLSDRYRKKIVFLAGLTLLSVAFTAFIGLTNNLFYGLLFFAIANFGYQVGMAVYNALLPDVASREKTGRVSGYGKALGYAGAIAGLFLVRPFIARGGRHAAFIPSAVLFLLFALPCFIFVREKKRGRMAEKLDAGPAEAFKMLWLRSVKTAKEPALMRFLLASFIAFNAINAIMVFMSVYASKVIGFTTMELNTFLVYSTIIAIFGCFAAGFVTDKIGAKNALCAALLLWCLTLVLAGLARSKSVFWFVGPLAGVSLGSTWVTSRAVVIGLVPEDMIAQAFGLFGLAGCVSAITGTLIWGLMVLSFGAFGILKYRISLLSLVLFFLAGLWLLRKVPEAAHE